MFGSDGEVSMSGCESRMSAFFPVACDGWWVRHILSRLKNTNTNIKTFLSIHTLILPSISNLMVRIPTYSAYCKHTSTAATAASAAASSSFSEFPCTCTSRAGDFGGKSCAWEGTSVDQARAVEWAAGPRRHVQVLIVKLS